MIDFDEVAFKLAKAEADNKVLQNKLERTRKALGIAVDALKRIKNHATAIDTAICRAEVALEQITALEQKE